MKQRMGVPVVTWSGERFAARMVASVLTSLGLSELIAQTRDEYVAVAAYLAEDLERLAALRAGLRERMRASPLCDGRAFTRRLEAAYRSLWRRWCARARVSGAQPPERSEEAVPASLAA